MLPAAALRAVGVEPAVVSRKRVAGAERAVWNASVNDAARDEVKLSIAELAHAGVDRV